MSGSGWVALTGTNTYGGGTTISGGVLSVGTLANSLPGYNTTGSVTIQTGGGLALRSVGDFNTVRSNITGGTISAPASGYYLGFDTSGGAINDSDAISGSFGLVEVGTANSLTLSGATANTYTGNTLVQGSGATSITTLTLNKSAGVAAIAGPELQLTGSNSTSYYAAVNFSANNQFGTSPVTVIHDTDTVSHSRVQLQGTTQTIAGLKSDTNLGVIQNYNSGGSANTGTLVIDPANGTSYTWSGLIRNGSAGTVAVQINGVGTGTQTFDSTTNLANGIYYTGATTINSGTLILQNTTGFASAITDYAALTVNMTGTNSNATVATVTGSGGTLTKNGTGTWSMSTATYTGPTIINQGTLWTSGSTFPTSGISIASGGTMTFHPGSGVSLTYNNAITGSGVVQVQAGGTGTFTLGGTASNSYGDTNIVIGGNAGTNGLVLSKTSSGVAIPGNLVIGLSTGGTENSGADQFVNCTQNNQFGPTSVVEFDNIVTYHGRFQLNGTTQTIAGLDNTRYGASPTGTGLGVMQAAVSGASGGTLIIQPANGTSYFFNGLLRNGGTGALNLQITGGTGTGTQTIASANITYTGATTINSGTLILQDTTGFASSGITDNGNLTINLSGANSLTYANAIGGSGSLTTNTSTGTLTLSANDGYSGNTTISSGRLALSGAGAIGSSPIINVASGATFNVSGVTGGNWSLGAAQTLKGSGTVTGAMTVNGTLSPGNSPGTLTTGAETWAGGGKYTWEINSMTGTAGTDPGWDLMSMTGLTMSATSGSPFTINVTSLTSGNLPGLVSGFDALSPHSWEIATTTGITGWGDGRRGRFEPVYREHQRFRQLGSRRRRDVGREQDGQQPVLELRGAGAGHAGLVGRGAAGPALLRLAEAEVIFELGFLISDLTFRTYDCCRENGHEFVAFARQIGQPPRLDDSRLGEEFQPIQGLVALANGDFERRCEVFSRRRSQRFAVVCAKGCSRFEDLTAQYVARPVARESDSELDDA